MVKSIVDLIAEHQGVKLVKKSEPERSLVDIIVGLDEEGINLIFIGEIGPLALRMEEAGEMWDGEEELSKALPDDFLGQCQAAGYDIGEEPVVVTTAWGTQPDEYTGWPWPVFLGVVKPEALAALFAEVLNGT